MTCSPAPRSIDEGLNWFLSHNPSGSGMCAQHVWHSLGGDRGCPPAWGCANANQVYDKVKKSGRYWTTPHRGDIALWKYGTNGHAARVYDNAGTQIVTTDPSNGKMVGIEPIGYPSKWGASSSNRIFTDTYNGVKCFTSEAPISHGDVYLEKLVYGQENSDSVKRLQMHLNSHKLSGGQTLPLSGNYFDDTDHEVRLCQQQHGFGNDPAGKSYVGVTQADHIFPANCGCTIITGTEELPDEPDEVTGEAGEVWDYYSGKPSGTLTIADSASYVKVDASVNAAPVSGIEFHMLYINLDLTWDTSTADGTIRVKYVRDGDDPTGYQDYHVNRGAEDFLITATHWEAGEKGVGGRWWVNVGAGISKAVGGTRYVKAGGVGY